MQSGEEAPPGADPVNKGKERNTENRLKYELPPHFYNFPLLYVFFSKHVANSLHLHCASFILATLDNAPNIPTLAKILGQSRKLRKENKKHKNSVKKYLHRQIANTRPIDNKHNMGNCPLSNSEKTVLNKGLSFVYSPDLVTEDEVFKAFLKFKRRMLLHYHFFIRPTISCKIVEPLRKSKVFCPPSPHCNVDWKQT